MAVIAAIDRIARKPTDEDFTAYFYYLLSKIDLLTSISESENFNGGYGTFIHHSKAQIDPAVLRAIDFS